METKPDAKPAAPAAAPAAPAAAKPAAPPPPPKPMEPKQLDEITEKFGKEYYTGRVCWIDGVEFSVQVTDLSNSNTAKDLAHPSILVHYKKYLPNNPMHALPRGSPGGVTIPKQYEKVPVVCKPA